MRDALDRSGGRSRVKGVARSRRRGAYRRVAARPRPPGAEALARQHDTLLAFATHDMINTLTVISGYTVLLQQHVAVAGVVDTERLAQGLTQIAAASARLGDQIAELADVSRLLHDQRALARRPIDLVALMRSLAACYQQTTEQHRIHVAVSAPELIGHWDARGLERVVSNLLGNAIKYSPGGGDIMISLARAELAGSAMAVLSIQDRGIGIPPDDLPRIFDPFQRAGNVGEISGVGLGLASAHQIVAQQGGTIAVVSTAGVGTTVTVRLPLER